MPKLDKSIYGEDDPGASSKVDDKLSVPEPTLDVWGEQDDRAKSEGNHGPQG